jgi:hypothetical protein
MKLSKLVCTAGFVIAAGVTGIAGGSGEAWGEGLPGIVQEAWAKQDLARIGNQLFRSAQRAENAPTMDNLERLQRRLAATASQLQRTSELLGVMADSLNVASVRWGEESGSLNTTNFEGSSEFLSIERNSALNSKVSVTTNRKKAKGIR